MKGPDIRARFTRYAIVGLVTNLAGYGLFLLLLFADIAPVIASGITYVMMVSGSYMTNRRWTFRSQGSHARDLTRYLLAYGVGLLVAMLSMYVLAGILHPALAQIAVIGLAAVTIFATLECLRFGKKDNGHAH